MALPLESTRDRLRVACTVTPLEDGQRTLHDGAVQEGLEYNIIYPRLFYLKFFKIPIYTHTYLWIRPLTKRVSQGHLAALASLWRLRRVQGLFIQYRQSRGDLELG